MRFLSLAPLLATVALLAGCQPPLEVQSIARRTFTITNRGDEEVRIERVVANDGDGRAECVQTPDVALGPGRAHSLSFFDCGEVDELEIDTDRGEVDLEWDTAANTFR